MIGSLCRTGVLVFFLLLCLGACGGGGGGGAPAPSTNAELVSLEVSAGALSPVFAPAVTSYTVGPSGLPATTTVTATTADAGATITVNAVAAVSGIPSTALPLSVGLTLVAVEVTAADGVTLQTYTIAITRLSDDASLSSLVASAGALAPAFDAGTLTYGVGPALLPGTTTITATPTHAGATLTVNTLATANGVESSPVALSPGLTPVTVEVTAEDGTTTATYTVVFDRALTAQDAYVKASNTGSSDRFGQSVSVSGDTLAVGVPDEDSSATGVNPGATAEADNAAGSSGAVYVFVRTGTTWTQQAYVKASNTGLNDKFGHSVSVSGDTLAVGAPTEDSSATGVNPGASAEADNTVGDSGAAYVFVRTGTTWTQQAYVKASNTGGSDLFGWSVSVAGDTLAVGARGERSRATGVNPGASGEADNAAANAGAAYVFVRTGTTWAQQAYVKASNTGASDEFGFSVSVTGDTLAVGAYAEDSSATGVNPGASAEADNAAASSGAVYVFVRTGTTWTQQAYVKASNTGGADLFGFSVSVAGDTLAVGAYAEASSATGVNPGASAEADNAAGSSGAVYVFVRTGTTWTQQAYVKASNTGGADSFGLSVSASGDTLLVGATGEDSSATGVNPGASAEADNAAGASGAVYVFVRTGTTWTQQAYVKASNTGSGDVFGYSVSVAGDTLAVGAISEASNATGVNPGASAEADNTAINAGAVYVFR